MGDGECIKAVSLLFRIAALGLSVAAAVVMATATQLVIVGGDRGSSSTSSYTISYSHYSALTYFVAATAISAVCTAAALYLYGVRASGNGWLPVMTIMDAAAQGFLFSAAGAAFAARGVIGGGGAAPWGGTATGSVCDAAGAFCGKVSVAAAVCALAAVAVAVAALAGDAWRGSSSSRGSCCDW